MDKHKILDKVSSCFQFLDNKSIMNFGGVTIKGDVKGRAAGVVAISLVSNSTIPSLSS